MVVIKNGEGHKFFWLYALKLENEKYYIGITTKNNPHERIEQHKRGFYGAKWTKKYRPLDTLEVIDLGSVSQEYAEHEEKKLTLKYMDKYGYQNVRGADLIYSGKYIKRFNHFFTENDWETMTVVVFLLLTILVLLVYIYL